MFTQNWRKRWGLTADPFACEDADKDQILDEVDEAAVHSGFDRIFGSPKVPAPGIVFGEKGSGKSGLRRMMKRRILEHNKGGDARILLVEYIDFDLFMERFRSSIGAPKDPERAAQEVLKRWETSDHLDALLSLAVTELVDAVADGRTIVTGLSRKQKLDALLLTALYHHSERRTTSEALGVMSSAVKPGFSLAWLRTVAAIFMALVAVGVAAVPNIVALQSDANVGNPEWWWIGGGVLLLLTCGWLGLGRMRITWAAKRAIRSVRVLPQDSGPLKEVLTRLRSRERTEFVLPQGAEDGTRYHLMQRLMTLLPACGFSGIYILVDRIDEPSFMSGSDERMRRFVERILDIKLLQFPKLALKLFLPIEMESLYRTASSEELKRMRLDKSNLIPELKWTGQELYEIANQRMRACLEPGSRQPNLIDLFEEGFDPDYLRDTLNNLGTPRYAFGFLSALLQEYVRELPNELADDDAAWRVPRSHFEVVRAGWIDRTGVLRRSLN